MTSALVVPVQPLVGANGAFEVVFGAFVVAVLVLAVVTLRWAIQRDRVGRAQWLRRQREAAEPARSEPPPATNGRRPPRHSRRGPKAEG